MLATPSAHAARSSLGHSESGFFPAQPALVNPAGMRGLILSEGFCNTALTRQQLATLARIPILVVYGDHLGDAPAYRDLWLGSLQGCTTFVQQVNQAGGDAPCCICRTSAFTATATC